MTDLGDLFKAASEEKRKLKEQQELLAQQKSEPEQAMGLSTLFKAASEEKRKLKEQQENTQAGKALKAVQERLRSNNDIVELMQVFVEKTPLVEIIKEVVVEKEVENKEVVDEKEVENKEVVDEKEVTNKTSFQQPAPQDIASDFKTVNLKLKFLEQSIGKIAATGPGSGEVNLRYLDDVDRSTIGDAKYLNYNATTKKFVFSEVTSTSTPPSNPSFTYTEGVLTSIAYGSGESKIFTYTSGILTQLDFVSSGVTTRKTFNYTSGILTSITQVTL